VLGCSHNSSYTSPSSNDLRRVNARLIDRCIYLLGIRSSESDAHTGPVRFLRLPTGGCQAQTRVANQRRIPCMITKERGGSQDSY